MSSSVNKPLQINMKINLLKTTYQLLAIISVHVHVHVFCNIFKSYQDQF